MLRRGFGFFGGSPARFWWRRLRRQQKRVTPLWRRRIPGFTAVWWGRPNMTLAAGLAYVQGACGIAQQAFRRLSARDKLNLLLVALALYFFTGWFTGLRAEPSDFGAYQRVVVWRHDTKEAVSMELEEYLKGVVAAEMPASFHMEALKAQAVAARTYTLHILSTRRGLPGHPEADLTTDPGIDQAWVSESSLRRSGFLDYYWRWRKISRAVDDTKGLVLTYGGDLIFAAFHSDSGGITEDAENYWSSRVPYLRSVEDPTPARTPYTETKISVPYEKVQEAVRKTQAVAKSALAAAANGPAKTTNPLVNILEKYPSGRVGLVQVGDKAITGRALREALGLRSNWFEVNDNGQTVEFTVHGNGHGVGMSQYGADAYARKGASFSEILKHYYTGVQIVAKY